MKRKVSLIYVAVFALTVVSCVDDYMDANPPLPLDAPFAYVTSSIPAGDDGIPLQGGEEVSFTIDIVDAPGALKDAEFTFSKGGEVVSHTFDQLIGKNSGSFEVTVKAPYNLNGGSTFSVAISDSQEKPKVLTISRVLDVSYLHEGPDFTVEIEDDDGVLYAGDSVGVIITVNEVPAGVIRSISVAGSAATLTFEQEELDALIGQSSGTAIGKLVVGEISESGVFEIAVSVTDELQSRQVVVVEDVLYRCSAAADLSGTYDAISNGMIAGDSSYYQLPSIVTISKINDGQYQVSDISFGLFTSLNTKIPDPDEYYEIPVGVLDVCGTTFDGIEGEDVDIEFEITGTIELYEEEVRAIKLEWVNEDGDSGTVTLLKQ